MTSTVDRPFRASVATNPSGELDSTFTFRLALANRDFPCWRWDGEVVWGLTFGILGKLLKLVRAPAAPLL